MAFRRRTLRQALNASPLSADDQLRIMGRRCWQRGDGLIDLTPTGEHTVVGRRRSKRWGTMRYARSLRAILGDAVAAQYITR